MIIQHHEPECHAEFLLLFLLLSSKSRSQRGLIIFKYDSFFYIFRNVDSLATKLGLMIHHLKPKCPVKKNWITAFRVKVTAMVKNVNVCPGDIFKITKHFVSKLGILMLHHESEHHAKRLICYFQGLGHCKRSYDHNMTISTVSFELWILLLPNLVC